jgi:hypothetical protein
MNPLDERSKPYQVGWTSGVASGILIFWAHSISWRILNGHGSSSLYLLPARVSHQAGEVGQSMHNRIHERLRAEGCSPRTAT